MSDTAALTALVVAAVALLIASAQLTQQLLSTAYVFRKCDRIVTGSLIRGGTRGSIATKDESGDRIPDDLTVAPMRVDSITLLLTCVAMGMQVFKYSPTTGEITLSGGLANVSSSAHPILGGLLHYSVFSDEPAVGLGLEVVKSHARALRGQRGVWANAVFGRFMDQSYRPQVVHFAELIERKLPILRACGWPEDASADRIGGAACFMVFGDVDVYVSAPPSVIRDYNAHFAEVIVKAHHLHLKSLLLLDSEWWDDVASNHPALWTANVASSPYPYMRNEEETGLRLSGELETKRPEASKLVVCQTLTALVDQSGREVLTTVRQIQVPTAQSQRCGTLFAWRMNTYANSTIRRMD
ncbi:MAG: hypothetical protein Q9203_005716 [Teloschistes exilis]